MPEVVIGFDFGLRSIGVALGQTLTKSSQVLATLKAKQGAPNWQQVGALLDKWQPDKLLVGYPLNMDDTESATSTKAKRFANQLRERFKLPVELVDERLSTQEARMRLNESGGFWQNKERIDGLAAQVIVEQWLSSQTNIRDDE